MKFNVKYAFQLVKMYYYWFISFNQCTTPMEIQLLIKKTEEGW